MLGFMPVIRKIMTIHKCRERGSEKLLKEQDPGLCLSKVKVNPVKVHSKESTTEALLLRTHRHVPLFRTEKVPNSKTLLLTEARLQQSSSRSRETSGL